MIIGRAQLPEDVAKASLAPVAVSVPDRRNPLIVLTVIALFPFLYVRSNASRYLHAVSCAVPSRGNS
jgi:hypothetical protein